MENEKILLVGAGYMAKEYAKVLHGMKITFFAIGKGKKNAESFKKETGASILTGGIEEWLKNATVIPKKAIVAVTEQKLGEITRKLIRSGVKELLVEKPGGIDGNDIKKVAALAKLKRANIYLGYNRRFFASTQKALEIIKKDRGVVSFNFEFSEWAHVIKKLKKNKMVLKEWFLLNSSHPIDLAFFMGGKPKKLVAFGSGGLAWGPKVSVFTGAGVTQNESLFSYQANWESPGRWGVEILTRKHRLIFRPLEKLKIQEKGSVEIKEVEIDDSLDQKYKPGLFAEIRSFLGNKKNLATIQEQVQMLPYYEAINRKSQ